MYRAQKSPRKALIGHSMYSVFQEITVPGAPGLSYSCGLEELHGPVPGLARACTLGLVLGIRTLRPLLQNISAAVSTPGT